MPVLDVLNHRDAIVAAAREHRRLVISAPPGSGKSTCVPRFFLEAGIDGTIIVLQPRRIAARSLAAYVSRQLNEKTGQTVGYQVRFDACTGPKTRIIYQTYGVFLKQLLSDPLSAGVGLVVLDEFHERTLETDLILAWLNRLRTLDQAVPPFVVMSATLQGADLTAYLDHAPFMNIAAAVYPVSVTHQPPQPFETAEQQALRALKSVGALGLDGSVLMFMPGVQEIRGVVRLAEPLCRQAGIPLLELHGRLTLPQQMEVLDQSQQKPCVIVATNVAETSLTIPGVTTVIDSGLERRAAYDHRLDRNTLYLKTISLSSAVQRAGRAGRVAPGRCIRLWSKESEQGMEPAVSPEIQRLELSTLVLSALSLTNQTQVPAQNPHVLSWPAPPAEERWRHAIELLQNIDAIDQAVPVPGITLLGQKLLNWPAHPLSARIMQAGMEHGVALVSAAIIALWENADRAVGERGSPDLLAASLRLAENPDDPEFSREVRQAFDALCNHTDKQELMLEHRALLDSRHNPEARRQLHKNVSLCWLRPLQLKIAVREETGARYVFTDGKAATIADPGKTGHKPPAALVALAVLETAGTAQNRRTQITQYLPVEPSWIAEVFAAAVTTEKLCRWDEKKRAAVAEVRTVFAGLVLSRTTMPASKADPAVAADLLAEQLVSGAAKLIDDEVQQLICRVRCVAAAFPEHGLPVFNDEDWRLVYHELAQGKSSLAEVAGASLLTALRDYLGPHHAALVERLAPPKVQLLSGRTGKIFYAQNAPPELSARITDFVGWRGPFTVCGGRVKGIFDILAPNYRTVQKTADLDSFWKNSYPEIKNQLQRRYPRHPWP